MSRKGLPAEDLTQAVLQRGHVTVWEQEAGDAVVCSIAEEIWPPLSRRTWSACSTKARPWSPMTMAGTVSMPRKWPNNRLTDASSRWFVGSSGQES